MSVSYDGLYLATVSGDKNMKVYDVRSFGACISISLYALLLIFFALSPNTSNTNMTIHYISTVRFA